MMRIHGAGCRFVVRSACQDAWSAKDQSVCVAVARSRVAGKKVAGEEICGVLGWVEWRNVGWEGGFSVGGTIGIRSAVPLFFWQGSLGL